MCPGFESLRCYHYLPCCHPPCIDCFMCKKTVYDFCKLHGVTSCKLLLAVSGGSDSIALFHIFSKLKESLHISEIGIAHVNHGLRLKESEKEAEFVFRLAKKEGFRFHINKLQGKTLKETGVEQWARNERYGFFAEVREKYGYRFVATGHTADDQAETLLMRIARGTGPAGLCGIHTVREDGVIRPLIKLRRKELKTWLEHKGNTWYEDSSNVNQDYKRNWIRHSILPILTKQEPKAVEHLAAFAEHMQKQMHFLNPLINKWVTEHVIEDEPDRFVLLKPFNSREDFLASEGIALLFRKHGISFDRKHIVGFTKETKRTHGRFLLKGGWSFYPGKDSVEILSDTKIGANKPQIASCQLKVPGTTICNEAGYCFSLTVHTRKDCDLQYDSTNRTVYVDAKRTGNILRFRAMQKSDVFQPLGFKKSINLIRFLKNQKISSFYRHLMSVIADNFGRIVWIPGVAVGHEYRVRSATKKLFRISCRRIS